MPPVEPILLNDNVISPSALSGWEWLVESILRQRESAMIDGKLTPHVFPIEPSAWNILKEYQHQHAIPAAYSQANESALEGKFSANTARIALILHVVNLIEAGANLSDCKPIPGETMKSACVIAEWFIDEGKRIYTELDKLASGLGGDMTLTPDQQEVMKVLLKHQPASIAELKRHGRKIREMKNPDGVLNELLKLGQVERVLETGQGSHGTERFRIKKSTVDVVAVDVHSAEHGKYAMNSNNQHSSAMKNEFSTLSEFDAFTESKDCSDSVVTEGDLPCCASCRRTERPCRLYQPSHAGCDNHQAKEGDF